MAMKPFGERLQAAMGTWGPLCVGIDPHPSLMRSWGLEDSEEGLRTFAGICADAFAGKVAVVKPQSAFFERRGSRGIAILEELLARFRTAGTLTLLDVKRGDIGSTMGGYADAYLADASPLAADAITVHPYLGYGSLRPALDLAAQTGRGVFVLALTSNPDGREVQHARDETGASVARQIVAGVTADNAQARLAGAWGSVGMVVGATVGSAVRDLELPLEESSAPLLAPGFGAQGAGAQAARDVFGDAVHRVVPASSRAVLRHGPGVRALTMAARSAAAEMYDVIAP